MSATPIRILVIDDTVTYRKIVSDALRDAPGVEVVGTAVNGRIGLDKIEELHPDLVTLDLEMPDVDGVEVLRRLKASNSPVRAIMLSAFTSDGAKATTTALRMGAFDFVLKPSGDDLRQNIARLRRELLAKIEAFAQGRRDEGTGHSPRPAARKAAVALDRGQLAVLSPEVVVIGVSTGGPEALGQVLPHLPADLAAPVLIVQHMPPLFTKSLADELDRRCPLHVFEAYEGCGVEAGQALFAPGGRQMKLERTGDHTRVRITDDPPESSCRPSVDYLFRSAAHHFGPRVLAVIMTGMGNDGALGCRMLKRRGATILAQSQETCVVYGMPMYPVEEGLVDQVTPLGEIAAQIVARVGRRTAVCS